ncbi:unnamed protein product [Rhizoctonia solani]|uniref:Uncharacterized protein n=1 Tax=Rhizoctonia solani TaxID=456999 RepID=A0A8H3BJH9_9AGAM|nr:unnamed protein product [Rhizoctonia solani]
MVFHPLARLFAILSVALTFGILVSGVPVQTDKRPVARGGVCLGNCITGTQTAAILTKLNGDLDKNYGLIDGHLKAGTDHTDAVKGIIECFNVATANIKALPKDMTGQLNGKGPEIAELWTATLTGLVERSAKWQRHKRRGVGDIFAGLSTQVGAAVSAAQGAVTGALGSLQGLASQILDASKPHWEQLLEQLVGHGLNILGSISETINNLRGSIV